MQDKRWSLFLRSQNPFHMFSSSLLSNQKPNLTHNISSNPFSFSAFIASASRTSHTYFFNFDLIPISKKWIFQIKAISQLHEWDNDDTA